MRVVEYKSFITDFQRFIRLKFCVSCWLKDIWTEELYFSYLPFTKVKGLLTNQNNFQMIKIQHKQLYTFITYWCKLKHDVSVKHEHDECPWWNNIQNGQATNYIQTVQILDIVLMRGECKMLTECEDESVSDTCSSWLSVAFSHVKLAESLTSDENKSWIEPLYVNVLASL